MRLLGRRTLAGLAADDHGDGLENRRLELRMGYGLSALGDRFTSTPELGLALSDGQREYSLGWRLGLAKTGGNALELRVEANRREAANDRTEPEHAHGSPGHGPVVSPGAAPGAPAGRAGPRRGVRARLIFPHWTGPPLGYGRGGLDLPGIRAWVVLDIALELAAGLVEQVRGHRYVDLRRCHAAVAEIGRKRWQESSNVGPLAMPRGQAVGGKAMAQRMQASRPTSGFSVVDSGRPKRRMEGVTYDGPFSAATRYGPLRHSSSAGARPFLSDRLPTLRPVRGVWPPPLRTGSDAYPGVGSRRKCRGRRPPARCAHARD